MVLRSLCVRSRGDLEGSTRCGKMPVVQDATHSATEKWWGLVCFDHTVSNVSISSVQRFTERSRLGRCYGCARGRFSWQPLSCQPWQRQPPPPHRVTACSIMPAFMDFPGDAAIIGNINLALYDLPQ
jgi:hypothetical protein